MLMLENRSFDHMLGYLYAAAGNVSPSGQPFEGLTGHESNPDASGNPVQVFQVTPATPNAYFMPGADPGEGYKATNDQFYGSDSGPTSTGQALPAYTFLEPSWSSTGNSQHQNYDVALGEQLIHDAYEALRSGPGWNQTLFILTYDEHGGCYDHVSPPWGATSPDATAGEFGFGFDRFGARVPGRARSRRAP